MRETSSLVGLLKCLCNHYWLLINALIAPVKQIKLETNKDRSMRFCKKIDSNILQYDSICLLSSIELSGLPIYLPSVSFYLDSRDMLMIEARYITGLFIYFWCTKTVLCMLENELSWLTFLKWSVPLWITKKLHSVVT